MKKNTMMRIASVLMIAVLMTTCIISATFAKYTTTDSTSDAARVAKWGFDNAAALNFENLFASTYNNVSNGTDDLAIIAPGTAGEVAFTFVNDLDGAPEVAYTFEVSTDGSDCNALIQANPNITWALAKTAEKDAATYGTWDELLAAIQALDGDTDYAAGELPGMVDTSYTVLWKWTYDNTATDGNADDVTTNDSYLGNEAVDADLKVTLKITITATQID